MYLKILFLIYDGVYSILGPRNSPEAVRLIRSPKHCPPPIGKVDLEKVEHSAYRAYRARYGHELLALLHIPTNK
jgi:hypothetical protein